jgi:hypothetical protein
MNRMLTVAEFEQCIEQLWLEALAKSLRPDESCDDAFLGEERIALHAAYRKASDALDS